MRKDVPSLVTGIGVTALGILLLLDFSEVIALRFDYAAPAVLAATGAVLLALGLTRER